MRQVLAGAARACNVLCTLYIVQAIVTTFIVRAASVVDDGVCTMRLRTGLSVYVAKCYTRARQRSLTAARQHNNVICGPYRSVAMAPNKIGIACFLSIFNIASEMFSIDVVNFTPHGIICLRVE